MGREWRNASEQKAKDEYDAKSTEKLREESRMLHKQKYGCCRCERNYPGNQQINIIGKNLLSAVSFVE